MRVVSVSFVTKPQAANPRLTFPKKIASLLGITSPRKKMVALVMRKPSGEILFAGQVLLRSGTEIYSATEIKPVLRLVKPGVEIWIEAWRPN
jgi:hypothetical protein